MTGGHMADGDEPGWREREVALTSNANDDTWENNAKYLLERCPHTVRVREGGGPENLMHSFIHTFMAMEQKLRGSHETPEQLPESLSDPAIVMERVRALHQQTDAALWLLRYLNRLGGLGQDKHRLIDAVLEGRAKVLGDRLHIEQPSEKASPADSPLCQFGGDYGWGTLEPGHAGPHDIRKSGSTP